MISEPQTRGSSLGSSMVRASQRSSKGCGFDPRLGHRNHFLSIELEDRSSTLKTSFQREKYYGHVWGHTHVKLTRFISSSRTNMDTMTARIINYMPLLSKKLRGKVGCIFSGEYLPKQSLYNIQRLRLVLFYSGKCQAILIVKGGAPASKELKTSCAKKLFYFLPFKNKLQLFANSECNNFKSYTNHVNRIWCDNAVWMVIVSRMRICRG